MMAEGGESVRVCLYNQAKKLHILLLLRVAS